MTTGATGGTSPTDLDDAVERGRGRPRTAKVGEAIHEAARAILASEGYEGLTFEAVAARAGVARSTVYRRYADRTALVVEMAQAIVDAPPEPNTGNFSQDLLSALWGTARTFSDPVLAAMMAAVVGQMGHDVALAEAMRSTVMVRRIAVMERVFTRAIRRGEIPWDTEWWLCTQRMVGPLLMRTLLTHEPIDQELVAKLVVLETRSLGLPDYKPERRR